MGRARFSTSRRTRFWIILAVILIHVVLVTGLIRALAPNITDQVVETVTAALTVTVTTPPPKPEPTPEPDEDRRANADEGEAAPPGKKAKPKEVTAPTARIAVSKQAAPKVASTGDETRSGARDEGDGTGAGGQGQGTGSGRSGDGQGGGGVPKKAVKVSGDINSARDYPKASRDLRLDDHVVVALTVGTDGRVKGCRVHRPSRDPEADRITCQLATERFRFEPATDANGNPVQSVYGWKQRWFKAGKN